MAKELRGADVLLKVDGVAVAGQRDCSLSMQGSDIDTTTKTNGGWKTSLQGLKEWSMTMDAVNYYGEAAAGQRALKRAFIASQNIQVIMAFGDEEVYMGEASITGLDMSGSMEDVSTSSITIKGASALQCEFAPIFVSASLDSTDKIATLAFDGNLADNTDGALKAAVTFAADGETFAALGTSDTVAIDGKNLVVTFSTALTGSTNVIKVAAKTFKTANGAIQSAVVTTGPISAE